MSSILLYISRENKEVYKVKKKIASEDYKIQWVSLDTNEMGQLWVGCDFDDNGKKPRYHTPCCNKNYTHNNLFFFIIQLHCIIYKCIG